MAVDYSIKKERTSLENPYINRPIRKSKRISVSSKRQISIPKEFFDFLEIGDEVMIELTNNELIIKPIQQETTGEFAQYILKDLIKEGYEGENLYNEFTYRQSQIRPALMKMIEEERSKAKHYTLDTLEELFKSDDPK